MVNQATIKIRDLAERILRQFPDFEMPGDPSASGSGHRLEIRRFRKGYGSFSDTDKVRQVQRELLHILRASGYKVHLGREDKESFVLQIEDPTNNPEPIDLQDEVRRALKDDSSK